jgi:hypothetical protein
MPQRTVDSDRIMHGQETTPSLLTRLEIGTTS